MITDEHTLKNAELTKLEGVSFGDVDHLNGGNCTLHISSVTRDHLGLWSCMLITKNSTVFSGAVNLGKQKSTKSFCMTITVLLESFISVPASTTSGGMSGQKNGPEVETEVKTGVDHEDEQMRCMKIMKQDFDEEKNCVLCSECDQTLKPKIIAAEDKLMRMQRATVDLTAARKCS